MKEGPGSYLLPEELAERWRTSTNTLSDWRRRGVGPKYLKVQSLVRYPVAWLEEYEQGVTVEPVA